MAAARAAARRQAILNSRGDRLAKLTSSARGDDPGGVYTQDDPPLPTLPSEPQNSAGEESSPSKPPSNASRISPNNDTDSIPQFPLEMPIEQQELFRSLMSGAAPGQREGPQMPPSITANPNQDPSAPSVLEDPFSALLASLGGGKQSPFNAPAAPPPRPRTRAQKWIPVLHALSMLAILLWFLIWKEPEEFANSWLTALEGNEKGKSAGYNLEGFGWNRWARLARVPPTITALTVPPLPAFFWAFTTVELLLHSLRLFSQPDEYRPPMLVELVLPHLPAPYPQAILTSLKYLQLGSLLLNDLAILIFGIGLIIFISNWTA